MLALPTRSFPPTAARIFQKFSCDCQRTSFPRTALNAGPPDLGNLTCTRAEIRVLTLNQIYTFE